jgi:3-hydroxybutyryl-CoA dehydrogenase
VDDAEHTTPARATVLGTGAMGPEIAAALAAAGVAVTLAGRDAGAAAGAADRAREMAGDGAPIAAAGIDAAAFAGSGLVVETISEDLGAKRDLLARVAPWVEPGARVVTNTSSLRIGDLAGALPDPGRFAGLHFLKPAHLTAVVEVVPGPDTTPDTTAALVELAGRMGKTPLVVRADVPGFIWNRIQFAVLRECLHMLEAGVADAADIDAAVADGLAPRWMAAGPLATADLGGLRTFARVSEQLFPELSAAREVPDALARPAREGGALAPWTAGAGEALADLRADALAAGRGITARRRGLGA